MPPETAAAGAAVTLERYHTLLETVTPIRVRGRVSRVIGLMVEVDGIPGLLGEMCQIERAGERPLLAEVVGFHDARALLMPLGDLRGVQAGAQVTSSGALFTAPVGPELLGRVLDGLGRPIDGRGPLGASFRQPLAGDSPHV